MWLRARAALAALALLVALPPGTGGASGAGGAGGPSFAARQRTAVLARAGDSAELACHVLRLADRVVSWVRSSDLQILTHAGAVFTADARVSSPPPAPPAPPADEPLDAADDVDAADDAGAVSVHALRIARLRAADAGRYECQVNTEPKMSLFFNLTVVESALPRVVVTAARGAVRAAAGGAARLACRARYEPAGAAAALPPLRISWTHAGREVDPQGPRGGVSLEAERWAGGAASRLTLAALRARDAGAYTCRAAGAADTVLLQLADREMEDEPLGEMQRDQAAAGGWRGGGRCAPLAALLALSALAVLAT